MWVTEDKAHWTLCKVVRGAGVGRHWLEGKEEKGTGLGRGRLLWEKVLLLSVLVNYPVFGQFHFLIEGDLA